MIKKMVCLAVAASMVFLANVPQGSAKSEANETVEREYGLIDAFSVRSGGEHYVHVVTKDGSIKEYQILGTAKKQLMAMGGRFDFISYKVSDGNVIKYGVVELMDGASG